MTPRDETLRALAATWVDATVSASHKPSAENLSAMIDAEGAFNRALAAPQGVPATAWCVVMHGDEPISIHDSEENANDYATHLTKTSPHDAPYIVVPYYPRPTPDDRIGDVEQRRLHDEGNARIGQRMSEYFRLDEEQEDDRVEVSQETPAPKVRTCNRHDDCDVADRKAIAEGRNQYTHHCHDDCCEDCFGA